MIWGEEKNARVKKFFTEKQNAHQRLQRAPQSSIYNWFYRVKKATKLWINYHNHSCNVIKKVIVHSLNSKLKMKSFYAFIVLWRLLIFSISTFTRSSTTKERLRLTVFALSPFKCAWNQHFLIKLFFILEQKRMKF